MTWVSKVCNCCSLSHIQLFDTQWLQHTRLPYPLLSPGVCPNSCLLSWWCPPTISSSVILFSSCPQSFPASGSFKWANFSHQVARYCSFSFNMNHFNEHPGLISFRMDWLHLVAVQGTLKSLLQYHSSKASILQCSVFSIVQLSHPYMTTGKTIALSRQTFVGKVMSLLFNMLSRLLLTFLPRSKHLIIAWLQSPSESASVLDTEIKMRLHFRHPVLYYTILWLW